MGAAEPLEFMSEPEPTEKRRAYRRSLIWPHNVGHCVRVTRYNKNLYTLARIVSVIESPKKALKIRLLMADGTVKEYVNLDRISKAQDGDENALVSALATLQTT